MASSWRLLVQDAARKRGWVQRGWEVESRVREVESRVWEVELRVWEVEFEACGRGLCSERKDADGGGGVLEQGALEVIVEPAHQYPPTVAMKLALLTKEIGCRQIIDPKGRAVAQSI